MAAFSLIVTSSILASLVIIRLLRQRTWGYYKDKSSLKGKVFLITGGNSGIGKETIKQLAARNAKVIMPCRTMQAANTAITDIRKFTHLGELIPMELDLSSFQSIRQFAELFNRTQPVLHVLINNAGVYFGPSPDTPKTKDGMEIHFGVNHLGHFLLTELLLVKLKQSQPSRVVIVSSTLHEKGELDLNDINCERFYKRDFNSKANSLSPGYCTSKLANVYHCRELAERLKNDNIDVSAVCPGWTYTGLFRNSKWNWFLMLPIAFFFMRSAWQGSQTVVMCATAEKLPGKSGDFYRNCTIYKSNAQFDDVIQKELWEKSLELVKLK